MGRLWLPFLAICSVAGLFHNVQAQQPDPVLPADDVQSVGYFPTIAEDTLLRGAADSRSFGHGHGPNNIQGPDTRGQVATDLFRYYDSDPDFYQRNQDFFRPLNRGLGIFTPNDALTIESNTPQTAYFTADADINLLTRTFVPEMAHLKAGPLYFDVLWAGAGVIFSDYNGRNPIGTGRDDDDGWSGFVEVGIRALVRITDSIYLSAMANLIYLPFENELAFRFGNGDNSGALLRLNINKTIGDWEILFFDEFRGVPGLDFFVDADSPALDQAGRYSFGFLNDRSNNFYDRTQAFFVNTVGFYASRPLFDNQWRFGLGIEHSDYWNTFSFANHGTRDWLTLWMQYEGSVIPFSPRFSYEYFSNDGYDSMVHIAQVHFTGRLTENIMWLTNVGYSMSTGNVDERNDFLWGFTLDHTITRSTHHWLAAGQNYLYNELQPDTRRATYVRYGIDQRFTSRFHGSIFAQYSENETSFTRVFPVRDRLGVGLSLLYRPLDFTDIRGSVMYEQIDQQNTDDTRRWLYRLEVTQQLAHRLTGNIFYQYEEMDSERNPFTEHFFGLSMRRYF